MVGFVDKKIEAHIAGREAAHHTLRELRPRRKYRIDVYSITAAGRSHAAILDVVTTESGGWCLLHSSAMSHFISENLTPTPS